MKRSDEEFEGRTERIDMRCSEQEKEDWTRAAKRAKASSLTDWFRRLANAAMGAQK